jgi:hypothetical protein
MSGLIVDHKNFQTPPPLETLVVVSAVTVTILRNQIRQFSSVDLALPGMTKMFRLDVVDIFVEHFAYYLGTPKIAKSKAVSRRNVVRASGSQTFGCSLEFYARDALRELLFVKSYGADHVVNCKKIASNFRMPAN